MSMCNCWNCRHHGRHLLPGEKIEDFPGPMLVAPQTSTKQHDRRHTCPGCGKSFACANHVKVAFFKCHWKNNKTKCYKCEEVK